MIHSELAFNKLVLMGRFQIVSSLYAVYSREFINLSLVEITYTMNTHQELEKILEVSSTVYINMYLANIHYFINVLERDFLLSFFMLCLFRSHAGGRTFKQRHIKKY